MELQQLYFKLNRKRRAYSAITPAIIIIGFVTLTLLFVAFLLNAGYYSMNSMENIISDASDEASTVLKLDGDVIVQTGDKVQDIQTITFTIRLIKGASPVAIDSQSTAISFLVKRYDDSVSEDWYSSNLYVDKHNGKVSVEVKAVVGTYTDVYDSLLEEGEIFSVTISIAPETVPTPHDYQLDPHDTFEISINLGQGAILSFSRTMPQNIHGIVVL